MQFLQKPFRLYKKKNSILGEVRNIFIYVTRPIKYNKKKYDEHVLIYWPCRCVYVYASYITKAIIISYLFYGDPA